MVLKLGLKPLRLSSSVGYMALSISNKILSNKSYLKEDGMPIHS